jgi:hypothetical protein
LLCHVLRDGELSDLWRSREGLVAWEVIEVPAKTADAK